MRRRFLSALLMFFVFAAAIIAVTWPWVESFKTRVIDHWDPPFHAWKLEYAAQQLLAGNILPPEGNTNMYYPYTGAFYYEALHWPQAIFAAILFACGTGPVMAYHVTLVAFWAFSGVCFWMMLRALRMGRFAAFAGGLLFVLIPYRVSYMPEFNMQLNFGLPLFFYFLIKFFRGAGCDAGVEQSECRKSSRQCALALGMTLAWWLQAVSELYQAVFLLFVLPFFACAMLSDKWRALRDWRGFWLPLAIATAVGGGLSIWFLWPYFTTLQSNTLSRSIGEVSAHVLEPLSYLRPFNDSLGVKFHARRDEMSVYPTISVMLLAAAGIVAWMGGWANVLRRKRLLSWRIAPLAAALALFAAIAIGAYFTPSVMRLSKIYALLPVVAVALLLPFLLRLRASGDDSASGVERAFARGLFAAAVFSFFMSLGPRIVSTNLSWPAPNKLFITLYNHIDALHGFRVISRFSIFVMMFLVTAAAIAIDSAAKRRAPTLPRIIIAALAVFFIVETLPTDKLKKTMPLKTPVASEVLKILDAQTEPFVLAMVPMGQRRFDSQMMLQVARYKHLSVYAWGGTYPEYTKTVGGAFSPRHSYSAKVGADLLRQLWPEAMLLEDKKFSYTISPKRNYAVKYSEETKIIAEDERFVLMSLNADNVPKAEWLKLIRHDYAAQHPIAEFTLGAPPLPETDIAAETADAPPPKIWLDCNDVIIGAYPVAHPNAPAEKFCVRIPPATISTRTPVRLRFHAENDAPFILKDFTMRAASDADATTATPRSAAPHPALPWLPTVDELPPSAQPFNARYKNGMQLHGIEVIDADFSPNGKIHIRYYITLPKKISDLTKTAIKTGITKDGAVILEVGAPLLDGVDMNYFWTGIRTGIYVYEQTFHPPDLDAAEGPYALSATIRTTSGKRLSGKDSDGKKVRRIHFAPTPSRGG